MKKSRIFLFVVLALVVAVIGVQVVGSLWVASNYKLTVEEAYQEIDARMAQKPQEFDEQHDGQETICRVNYVEEITVRQPSFTLEGISRGPFVKDGWVGGTADVIIDCPAAYPYLEKEPEAYNLSDVEELDRIQEEILIYKTGTNDLPEWEYWTVDKYSFRIEFNEFYFLDSEGNQYRISYYVDDAWIFKNGDCVYDYHRSTSSGSGEKCSWCNGTGYVKYNYGDSDLEAILSGNDPYTYGVCGSCGGTGKAK